MSILSDDKICDIVCGKTGLRIATSVMTAKGIVMDC